VARIRARRELVRTWHCRAASRPGTGLVFVVGVAVPLAACVPFAAEAWQGRRFAWDTRVSHALRSYASRNTVLNRHVDVFGLVLDPVVQALGGVFVAMVVLALLARGRLPAALLLAGSVGGAVVIAPLLKGFFAPPPVGRHDIGDSFPSGHALRTLAAAGSLTLVAWPTAWRRAALVAGSLVVALSGLALVSEGWHSASDVFGGWCLGSAWVACVWLGVRSIYADPARQLNPDGVSRAHPTRRARICGDYKRCVSIASARRFARAARGARPGPRR
jgi:undecaprenyl-diphosphatase